MSIASVACTKPAPRVSIDTVLERPLIVGASVSGDYLTPSPGKVLALRYTSADQIQVIAQKGKPGRELLDRVSANNLKDRSIIIGVDLFFWDSFSPDSKASTKAMADIVAMAKAEDLPIILGDIPVLMPMMQKSAKALNEGLIKACEDYKKCKILPMKKLFSEVLSTGSITHLGTKYTLAQLLPDGLHIAKPASEYLADQISDLIQQK